MKLVVSPSSKNRPLFRTPPPRKFNFCSRKGKTVNQSINYIVFCVLSFLPNLLLANFSMNESINYIEISSQQETINITDNCLCWQPQKGELYEIDKVKTQTFLPVDKYKLEHLQSIWLKCGFKNSDTIHAYTGVLNVGQVSKSYYYYDINTQKKQNGRLVKASDRRHHPTPYSFEITIPADTQTISYLYLYHFDIHKKSTSIDLQISNRKESGETNNLQVTGTIIQGILNGIFLAFFIHAITGFLFTRERFLFYWAGYIFFTFWYILYEAERNPFFNLIFSEYPFFFVYCSSIFNQISIIFYILFFREILGLRKHLPKLSAVFDITIGVLCFSLLIDVVLNVFFKLHTIGFFQSLLFRTLALFVGLYSIYIVLKHRLPYAIYVGIGTGCYLTGAILLIANTINVFPTGQQGIYSPIFFFEMGTLFELILFSFAIGQKQRNMEKEKIKIENDLETITKLEAAKTTLYTNITHEFRTPLTVINGLSEQPINENDPINMKERFGLIQRNSTQLLNLINQLLDLSKMETGDLSISYIQGDIISFLKYLVHSFDALAKTQEKELTFTYNRAYCLMDFDPQCLHRITNNLISNALKFTDEQGIINVIVNLDDSERELFLKIQDNGIGIATTDLPHIFDRFYQVETFSNRKHDGTGIGLALVKELVQLLNGTIQVNSELGSGTTFSVGLPVNRVAPTTHEFTYEHLMEKQPITPSSFKNPTNPASKDSPILLIIEDNQDVVSYIQSCLIRTYQILIASNGQEGIDLAKEQIPDIIISDVMMPLVDGFEVCNNLKNTETTSHIPIILLTAKSATEDRLVGLRQGADAYLVKPFNKEELLIRIEQLLRVRKNMQQYFSKKKEKEKVPTEIIKEDQFLQKVNAIIDKHLSDETFKPAQLCEALFYSKMQVHRKIKAITNLNTSQYLRQYRLNKAKTLLDERGLTIKEIAFAVGFSSTSYFSRAFKEFSSITPSAYLKKDDNTPV